MIRDLTISNFQSHQDSILQFSPRVNVILGVSDSGKSAIMRSLRWLLLNRPSGKAFISHWCKKGDSTEAKIMLADGTIIIRSRSQKDNLYTYTLPKSEDAHVLEAVRTDVPDEVARLLNMDEVINIQGQGDRPFLLDTSPPEVARILNATVGLDGIDEAHSRIAGKIRQWQDSTRQNTASLQSLSVQAEAYQGVDELQEKADNYGACEVALARVKTKYQTLDSLRIAYRTADQSVKATELIIPLKEKLSRLNEALQTYNTLMGKAATLGAIGKALAIATTRYDAYQGFTPDGLLNRLDGGAEKAASLAKRAGVDVTLVAIGKSMGSLTEVVTLGEAELKKLQVAFNKLACPTCGTVKGGVRA